MSEQLNRFEDQQVGRENVLVDMFALGLAGQRQSHERSNQAVPEISSQDREAAREQVEQMRSTMTPEQFNFQIVAAERAARLQRSNAEFTERYTRAYDDLVHDTSTTFGQNFEREIQDINRWLINEAQSKGGIIDSSYILQQTFTQAAQRVSRFASSSELTALERYLKAIDGVQQDGERALAEHMSETKEQDELVMQQVRQKLDQAA